MTASKGSILASVDMAASNGKRNSGIAADKTGGSSLQFDNDAMKAQRLGTSELMALFPQHNDLRRLSYRNGGGSGGTVSFDSNLAKTSSARSSGSTKLDLPPGSGSVGMLAPVLDRPMSSRASGRFRTPPGFIEPDTDAKGSGLLDAKRPGSASINTARFTVNLSALSSEKRHSLTRQSSMPGAGDAGLAVHVPGSEMQSPAALAMSPPAAIRHFSSPNTHASPHNSPPSEYQRMSAIGGAGDGPTHDSSRALCPSGNGIIMSREQRRATALARKASSHTALETGAPMMNRSTLANASVTSLSASSSPGGPGLSRHISVSSATVFDEDPEEEPRLSRDISSTSTTSGRPMSARPTAAVNRGTTVRPGTAARATGRVAVTTARPGRQTIKSEQMAAEPTLKLVLDDEASSSLVPTKRVSGDQSDATSSSADDMALASTEPSPRPSSRRKRDLAALNIAHASVMPLLLSITAASDATDDENGTGSKKLNNDTDGADSKLQITLATVDSTSNDEPAVLSMNASPDVTASTSTAKPSLAAPPSPARSLSVASSTVEQSKRSSLLSPIGHQSSGITRPHSARASGVKPFTFTDINNGAGNADVSPRPNGSHSARPASARNTARSTLMAAGPLLMMQSSLTSSDGSKTPSHSRRATFLSPQQLSLTGLNGSTITSTGGGSSQPADGDDGHVIVDGGVIVNGMLVPDTDETVVAARRIFAAKLSDGMATGAGVGDRESRFVVRMCKLLQDEERQTRQRAGVEKLNDGQTESSIDPAAANASSADPIKFCFRLPDCGLGPHAVREALAFLAKRYSI